MAATMRGVAMAITTKTGFQKTKIPKVTMKVTGTIQIIYYSKLYI